jgi:hypothetical protein
MATLLQHRPVLLIGVLALGLAMLAGPAGSADADTPVDAVLADVSGEVVTASDIALARALTLFGFAPSGVPIVPKDVERFLDALLLSQEAQRLRIESAPAERETAWQEAADRVGGPGALAAWLNDVGIAEAWARRLVDTDLARRRFIEVRFRTFAFVSEAEIAGVLGPGDHPTAARDLARAGLVDEAVTRALSEWMQEARSRAQIRRVPIPVAGIPVPLPMPTPARP